LITAGAVASRPVETLGAAAKAPGALVNFGGNLADLAADPSLDKAKELVTENPLVAGAVATAGLIATGVGVGAIANTLATAANTRAIKASTKADQILSSGLAEEPSAASLGLPPNKLVPVPTLAPERSITAGTPKRRKKRALATQFQNIFKPQVIVVNRNG